MGQSTSEQEGQGYSEEVGFDYSIYLTVLMSEQSLVS